MDNRKISFITPLRNKNMIRIRWVNTVKINDNINKKNFRLLFH